MSGRPLLAGLLGGACHGVALLDREFGGGGRTVVGDTGGLAEIFAAVLIVAGFVTIAMALRDARGVGRARAGFLYGAVFSLVALHWIPAAAGVWFGSVGGFAAGLTVWTFHGVLASIAFELVGRSAVRVGLPLAMVPGWIVLEWLPSAIPLVHLPRPELASALVDVPGVLAGASVLGGTGVTALVAGLVAAGVVLDNAIRDRSGTGGFRDPEEASTGASDSPTGAAGAPHAPAVHGRWRTGGGHGLPATAVATLLLLLLLGASAFPGLRTTDRGAGEGDASMPVVVAELPLSRAALSDSELRRAELARGIRRGPADLWPESVLPDASLRPRGMGGTQPLVGVRWRSNRREYNAVARFGEDGPGVVLHRKHRLVPGVERRRLQVAGEGDRGLAPGPAPAVFDFRGRVAGALICFEILFPAEVATLRRAGATVLLHVGNDAMLRPGPGLARLVLGETPSRQQERILRLRALEFGLPIVRSSSGGWAGGWGADGRPLVAQPVAETGGERLRMVVTEASSRIPALAWLAPWIGWGSLVLLLWLGWAPVRSGARGFRSWSGREAGP